MIRWWLFGDFKKGWLYEMDELNNSNQENGNGFFKGKVLTELSYIKQKVDEHSEHIESVTEATKKILSENKIREIFENECAARMNLKEKNGCPAARTVFREDLKKVYDSHLEYHKLNEGAWGIRTLIKEYPARAIAGTVLIVAYLSPEYRAAILDLLATGKISPENYLHLKSNFVLTVIVVIALMYIFRSMIGRQKI